MSAELPPDTQAILLLTAPLTVGRGSVEPPPLTDREYNRLAGGLRKRGRQPADLMDGVREALGGGAHGIDRERLERLLGRGFLLAQAVERWRARAIWVVSRADAGYPRRLKERLGERAPPVLYGCGERKVLDEGGLAVVGSRNAGDDMLACAASAGRLAAAARRAVISGGARGVDRAAMNGALEDGGRAVGILADGLERAAMRRADRDALMEGRLVLACSSDPAARFQVWRAMRRNALIYALADAALVVQSDHGKGGTWAGAAEQIERTGGGGVYVREPGEADAGLKGLLARGARKWPGPTTPEELEDLLDVRYPAAGGAAHGRTPSLGLRDDPASAARAAPVEPASGLYAKVRELVARECADEPRSVEQLADALQVGKGQMRDWLARMVSEGAVEKETRPVRYRAVAAPGPLFAPPAP